MIADSQRQPDLFDSHDQQRLKHLVPALVEAMRGRGWTKRVVLSDCLKWSDRVLREVKSLSDGQIISLSSKGYCLVTEASAEEISHAVRELRSRATEHNQYAEAIEERRRTGIHHRDTESTEGK